MDIKNIIFDWSGTLSDDFTPVYQASMLVFKKLGLKSISSEEYRREFILPYMLFWRKYSSDLTRERCDELFYEAIEQVSKPTLYSGVKEELERLKSLGTKMIVISAHPHEKIIREATDYGVRSLFREINGGIHDKTETILDILQRNDFDPEQTMYVGDMEHDIDAGRKAGVMTVALGWGYQTKEKLMESNPDRFMADVFGLDKLSK